MPEMLMPEMLERDGRTFFLGGGTNCPSPEACDMREGESREGYVERHFREHGFPSMRHSEDVERTLGLHCFYFFNKHIIGNYSLLPSPFWEIHEFISNWEWNEDDLEQRLPMRERTFRLPPVAERRTGAFRPYKQVEVPRQCQKTSTVSIAYVTWETLRQYYLFGNENFRTIITSATATLTRDLLFRLRSLWARSKGVKRLYGAILSDERGSRESSADVIRARWLAQQEDADGLAAFTVRVAGVGTETTGQRPDLYVFDDPATMRNSGTPLQREKVLNTFLEQVNQLEFGGKMIVCNTRKHLDDFGGRITKEPLRSVFYTLHRKAEWYDKDGVRHLYYPVKGGAKPGTLEPALTAAKLDELRKMKPEREYSAEYLNEPMDPTRAIYTRDAFPVVEPEQAPIEVRFGLGRNLTREEEAQLSEENVSIWATNHVDPAGKEDQSRKGDNTSIVGWRRDRHNNLYVTYLRSGQWPSSRLWNELYEAFLWNRPQFTDYEMPASEMHVVSSYQGWCERKRRDLMRLLPPGSPPPFVDIRPKWEGLPKGSKMKRMEALEPWTKAGKVFILSTAGPQEEIDLFIQQFCDLGSTDHDDYPDAATRVIRFTLPLAYEEVVHAEEKADVVMQPDGSGRFNVAAVRGSASGRSAAFWGDRG
jgi:hypothetical protein